jgi:hypothetical protein
MIAIFTSVYCILCAWSLVALLGTFGVTSFVLNSWVPFKGPLPSDGPVEGFASKQARIEWFDTSALRVRTASKYALIGAATWLAGVLVALLFKYTMGG